MQNKKTITSYIIVITFSILFIYFGNKYTSNGFKIFSQEQGIHTYKAKVIEIIGETEYLHEVNLYEGINITFLCKILNGYKKGYETYAEQYVDSFYMVQYKKVEKGDKIILDSVENAEDITWIFNEYDRSTSLTLLALTFFILLVIFGRAKGINTIISLIITCIIIFYVFIPSVLSGMNIYFWSILISITIVLITLIIVNGTDKKSLATIIGCIGGLVVSGILVLIMNKTLNLTGMVDENSFYLSTINPDVKIDLKAIVFAGIIIGALGAVMDVSMSISSSLYELSNVVHIKSKYDFIKSGLNIGRDIMGTMANTLMLAYIGSSLSVTLLLTVNNSSFIELINKEMVIVEVLQALIEA